MMMVFEEFKLTGWQFNGETGNFPKPPNGKCVYLKR